MHEDIYEWLWKQERKDSKWIRVWKTYMTKEGRNEWLNYRKRKKETRDSEWDNGKKFQNELIWQNIIDNEKKNLDNEWTNEFNELWRKQERKKEVNETLEKSFSKRNWLWKKRKSNI